MPCFGKEARIVYTIFCLMRSKKFSVCFLSLMVIPWYGGMSQEKRGVMVRRMRGYACRSVVVAAMFLTGCSGVRLQVLPDPATVQLPPVTGRCGTVAVRELTPDRVYAPAGNLAAGFARELVLSGLFDTVYYPSRADDTADLTLEGKFDVGFEPHAAANVARSMGVWGSLFLLEPAIWYEYGYDLAGRVTVAGGQRPVRPIVAAAHAGMRVRFLSLADVYGLEQEALDAAKRSLFRQLLAAIGDACGSRE